jgi:fibronectin-binding autotransporter adhesin
MAFCFFFFVPLNKPCLHNIKSMVKRVKPIFRISGIIALLFAFLLIGNVSEAVIRTSTGTTWTAANFGGTLPANGDTVIINSNMTGGPAAGLSFARLVVNSGFTFTNSTTAAYTISGTTSIDGIMSVTGNSGLRQFAGAVSINAGGSLLCTSSATFEFRGGIVNNGTCTLTGSGAKTFSTTAAQSLSGTSSISLATVTVNTGITLTNNNSGTLSFSTSNTITGSYVAGSGSTTSIAGTFSIGGSYTGNAGSVTGFATAATLAGAGTFSIPELSVPAGVSVTHSQTGAFTVSGTTTLDGTWSLSAGSGLKLFSNAVTINSGGSLSGGGNAPMEFRNGITNNGTLNLTGTGAKSFTTNNQSVGGTANFTMASLRVATGITLTNNTEGTSTHGGTNVINGTYNDGLDAGSFVFSGTLSVPIGGSLSALTTSPFTFSSASASAIVIAGTLDIGNISTTAFTASQTISGAGNVTFSTSSLNAGITLTISNTGIKQFYGAFTIPATAILTVTAAAGDLVFTNNMENAGTVTLGACPASIGGSLNSSAGTITGGAGIFSVGSSVNLTGAAILNLSTSTFSAVGPVNLGGTSQLTDGSSTGSNTFGGLVTVAAGCTFSTTLNSAYDFRAGIANDGTVNLGGTGLKSFTVFNQDLTGSGNITFSAISIPSGRILTNLNSGIITIGSATTASTIAGTYLDGDDAGTNVLTGTINISAGGTLNSATTSPWNLTGVTLTNAGSLTLTGTGDITSTTASTLAGTSGFTLNNLTVPASITFTLSNTAAKSISGNCTVAGTFSYTGASGLLTIGGNLAVSGTYTNGGGGTLVNGSVDLSGTGNVNFGGGNFTAGTTFNMSGTSTISDGSATGTNLFTGLVTIGSGCSFSNAAISIIYDFRGGIANNGTFNLSGGTVNFSTNNQTIQGNTISINTSVIAAGITVSSSGAVPVTFGATLTLNGNLDLTGAGTTTLNATAMSGAGNAVLQTLVLNSGTNTQTGTMTVLGTTSVITASHTISATAGLKRFDGLVSISTALTLSVSGAAPLQFGGGITSTGTFTQAGAGAVSFSGRQTIDGIGAVSFAGAVSSTEDLLLFKPSGAVTFNAAFTTGDTLYLLSNTACNVNGVTNLASLSTIANTTLTINANNFTVIGATNIGGLVVDIATGGTDTFTGPFTIATGGEFREQAGVSSSPWVFGSTFDNNGGFFNNTSSGAIVTFNGNVVNTGTFTRSGAAAPVILNNNISFTSNSAINITSGGVGCALTVNGNATIDLGSNSFTIGGDLNVNTPGSLNILSTGAFNVGGVSTITGTLELGPSEFTATGATNLNGSGAVTDGNDAGNNTFTGLVTLSASTGSFSSSNNSPYSFAGGITNAGTVNLSGTGTVTFNNTQTIAGAGAFQFQNFTVPATRTLTISATGVKSISGDVTNNGTITHSAASGTLAVNGTMNNTGTLTGGAAPLTMGVYTATGNFTNGAGATTVNGAVSLSGTANINMNSGNFSALSTTSLSGTSSITDANSTGSNLFTGLVLVGSGSSFSSASNSIYDFRGGIQHDGSSFSLTGSGAITFSTNNQSISGSSAMTMANVSIAGNGQHHLYRNKRFKSVDTGK